MPGLYFNRVKAHAFIHALHLTLQCYPPTSDNPSNIAMATKIIFTFKNRLILIIHDSMTVTYRVGGSVKPSSILCLQFHRSGSPCWSLTTDFDLMGLYADFRRHPYLDHVTYSHELDAKPPGTPLISEKSCSEMLSCIYATTPHRVLKKEP